MHIFNPIFPCGLTPTTCHEGFRTGPYMMAEIHLAKAEAEAEAQASVSKTFIMALCMSCAYVTADK